MVRTLQPYIVTSWHGHRQDADLPDAVRTVWREKFVPARGPQQRGPRQSNVDLAILDSKGNVVHWFDGFQHQGHGPRTLAQYTNRELQTATKRLDLSKVRTTRRPVRLPDLEKARGVRVIATLKDDLMRAYSAPIVEVVQLNDKDWKILAYSARERTVEASTLKKWLSQLYPPGVMERTNPRTKEAYQIKSVAGKLTLSPAGSNGKQHFMILRGKIRLTDEGSDNFSYDGNLEIVLTYKRSNHDIYALRGVYDGIYPRFDRMQNRVRNIPLQAVFESRNTEH